MQSSRHGRPLDHDDGTIRVALLEPRRSHPEGARQGLPWRLSGCQAVRRSSNLAY